MKQHEAVVIALEKLGGQALLADLYRETMKVEGCVYKEPKRQRMRKIGKVCWTGKTRSKK